VNHYVIKIQCTNYFPDPGTKLLEYIITF